MAKMNYKQIEHAEKRLREAVEKKVGPEPKRAYPRPTDKRFLQDLACEKIRIPAPLIAIAAEQANERSAWNPAGHFVGCLIEAWYDKTHSKHEKNFQKALDAWRERRNEVEAAAEKVRDQLILGDHHEALRLLEEFASTDL